MTSTAIAPMIPIFSITGNISRNTVLRSFVSSAPMSRVGRAIPSTRGRCVARHFRSANSLTIQKQYIGTRTMNMQRRYSRERVGISRFEAIRIRRLVRYSCSRSPKRGSWRCRCSSAIPKPVDPAPIDRSSFSVMDARTWEVWSAEVECKSFKVGTPSEPSLLTRFVVVRLDSAFF